MDKLKNMNTKENLKQLIAEWMEDEKHCGLFRQAKRAQGTT